MSCDGQFESTQAVRLRTMRSRRNAHAGVGGKLSGFHRDCFDRQKGHLRQHDLKCFMLRARACCGSNHGECSRDFRASRRRHLGGLCQDHTPPCFKTSAPWPFFMTLPLRMMAMFVDICTERRCGPSNVPRFSCSDCSACGLRRITENALLSVQRVQLPLAARTVL